MADERVVYLGNKTAKETEKIGETAIGVALIDELGGILKMLLQGAMTNGLIGALVCLVTADLLYKANVIEQKTLVIIQSLVVAGAGIALTSETITAIESALHFTGTSSNPQFAVPSVNVLVLGAEQNEQLNTLLKTLNSKK